MIQGHSLLRSKSMSYKLNRQLETLFHVKSVAPAGLRLKDLKPFQVGILDVDTQKTVSSAAVCSDGRYEIVWKSPAAGFKGPFGDVSGLRTPLKSLEIGKVDRVISFEEAGGEIKPFIGYLGNDGVSPCDDLIFECGTTYQLLITLSGPAIQEHLSKPVEAGIISFTTPCCDGCPAQVPIKDVLPLIIKEIDNQFEFGKEFFDVYPIYNCCPTPAPFPRTNFFDYCLEVCDTGDDNALGDVQSFYQDLDVVRSGRIGATSTYKVSCVSAAPAPYTYTNSALPDCDTCSAGFTLVPASKRYMVTIDNAGVGTTPAAWLTEVQAAGAFSAATSATQLMRNGSVSVYEVLVPASFVEPVAPIAETSFKFLGETKAVCVANTPVTIAWTQCGESYKIERTLCMTLKNDDCGSAAAQAKILADMTAFYASVPSVVQGSITETLKNDCLTYYEIRQYSNCLMDGCDTSGADKAKFDDLPGFGTGTWEVCKCEGWTFDNDGCPVPPTTNVDNCMGGLKFVGKIFEDSTIPCVSGIFDSPPANGVHIEVSLSDPNAFSCTSQNVAWKVVQMPSAPRGKGSDWAIEEATSRGYDLRCYISPDAPNGDLLNSALGQSMITVDADKYYNAVRLFHRYTSEGGYHAESAGRTREVITLIVEAQKTGLLQELKKIANSFVSAAGGCKVI